MCTHSRLLKPGGTLLCISFHSLEDRIIKRHFQGIILRPDEFLSGADGGSLRTQAEKIVRYDMKTKQIIQADETELNENPRARSAKLRYGTKLWLKERKKNSNHQRANPEIQSVDQQDKLCLSSSFRTQTCCWHALSVLIVERRLHCSYLLAYFALQMPTVVVTARIGQLEPVNHRRLDRIDHRERMKRTVLEKRVEFSSATFRVFRFP